jgi:predicted dehydrogenase
MKRLLSFESSDMSRREFIQESAAAISTLGLTLAETAHAQARKESARDARPVNVAFIGVGAQGYGVDFKRLMSIPGVHMKAICDIYEPFLQRALKDAPGAEGYKDYRRVIDRNDIEAVCIATPLLMHAPIATAALESGKHVFSEKMMAYSIEDAKKMARMAKSKKVILQIGHQRKSSILYNHGWELIQKDKVCGLVTQIRAQWNRNGSWRRAVPPDLTDRQWNWRLYKETSQGLMAELATHQIQVVNWFLGAVPTAVVGMGGIDYWKDGRTVFDNVEVVFEYPGGVKLNYTSLTTNQFDGFYEQFMGKDGTLRISEEGGGEYYREPSAPPQDWMKHAADGIKPGEHKELALKLDPSATKKLGVTGEKVGQKTITGSVAGKDDYQMEFDDFIASIRTGAPVSCTPEDGLGACVAAIRANEAMTKKSRIVIPSEDYII